MKTLEQYRRDYIERNKESPERLSVVSMALGDVALVEEFEKEVLQDVVLRDDCEGKWCQTIENEMLERMKNRFFNEERKREILTDAELLVQLKVELLRDVMWRDTCEDELYKSLKENALMRMKRRFFSACE